MPNADAPLRLGEGITGLSSVQIGGRECRAKCEQFLPTGSFKDRGAAVLLSVLRAMGVSQVVEDSSGNAGASLAAYAGRAGLEAFVFVPEAATALGKLSQAVAGGARVVRIAGDFDVAMSAVRQLAREGLLSLVNSINPWRLEGQRTIVFELLEACGWDPPEWFVFPAGNLGNCAAFGKALRELRLYHPSQQREELEARLVQGLPAAEVEALFRRFCAERLIRR